MSKFQKYSHILDAMTPRVNTGIFCAPATYESIKRIPPALKLLNARPPIVEFPEDRLYAKLLKKRPLLELEIENPECMQRSIAHRWARKQSDYIEMKGMTEKEAFKKCETEFDDEVESLMQDLHHIRESNGLSLNLLERNIAHTKKISVLDCLGQVFEQRLNAAVGRRIIEPALYDKDDNPRRRMAKLKRLGNDPSIDIVYRMLSPREAPVFSALKQLMIYPKHPDLNKYEKVVLDYMWDLKFALNSTMDEEEKLKLQKNLAGGGDAENENLLDARQTADEGNDDFFHAWDDLDSVIHEEEQQEAKEFAEVKALENNSNTTVEEVAEQDKIVFEGKTRSQLLFVMQETLAKFDRFLGPRPQRANEPKGRRVLWTDLRAVDKKMLVELVHQSRALKLVQNRNLKLPRAPATGKIIFDRKAKELLEETSKHMESSKTVKEIMGAQYGDHLDMTWYRDNKNARSDTQNLLEKLKAKKGLDTITNEKLSFLKKKHMKSR